MRAKATKRQPSCLPFRQSHEVRSVGLPRTCEVGRPKMNPIFPRATMEIQFDPAPGTRIYCSGIRRKIERYLNKTAIVLEADVAPHANGETAAYYLPGHGPAGNATHDLIGEELPSSTDTRERRLACQVIDDRVRYAYALAHSRSVDQLTNCSKDKRTTARIRGSRTILAHTWGENHQALAYRCMKRATFGSWSCRNAEKGPTCHPLSLNRKRP